MESGEGNIFYQKTGDDDVAPEKMLKPHERISSGIDILVIASLIIYASLFKSF